MRKLLWVLGFSAVASLAAACGDDSHVGGSDDDDEGSVGGDGGGTLTSSGGQPSSSSSGAGGGHGGDGGANVNCGDGAVDVGEQCDGSDLAGETCMSLGLGNGTLACTMRCQFDATGCEMQGDCGDGMIGPGEECDDGGAAPGDGCGARC